MEAYDFIDKELGKVTPYGAYDITRNNVGTDNDTAQFAVRSIQRWWEELRERIYPDAEEVLIMAMVATAGGIVCGKSLFKNGRIKKGCLYGLPFSTRSKQVE